MRVDLVQVTDPRKKPSGLDGESVRQGKGLDVTLLHADTVFGRYRRDQGPAEVMIDVCRNGKLRFTQAEASHSRPDIAERRRKAVDLESVRILGKIRVDAVQDHRNGGVHSHFNDA